MSNNIIYRYSLLAIPCWLFPIAHRLLLIPKVDICCHCVRDAVYGGAARAVSGTATWAAEGTAEQGPTAFPKGPLGVVHIHIYIYVYI